MSAVLESITSLPHDSRGRALLIGDVTDRRPSGRELELLATGRAYVHRKDGRDLLVPIMGGGAVGAGAVLLRNLPAPGTWVLDPVKFAALTSRNRKPYPTEAWPGYASKVSFRIDKVGVVGRIFVEFDGSITAAAIAPTATANYPWGIISRLKVTANGISNLYYCDGWDLRALERVRRGFFFDRESTFALPAASATVDWYLAWEVPLAFDTESLIGAIFAQTEENELTIEIATPASADLWSANAPTTVSGNFRIVVEYFSLPTEETSDGRKVIIPDIRQLHGFVAKDEAITGTGEHTAKLMRTGGILTRVFQRADNAFPAAGALDVATYVSGHKFRYGGNVIPLEVPGRLLRHLNEVDIGDRLIPAADVPSGATAPRYLVDDLVKANAVRDVIHLLGVTEPELLNQIDSGATINAGAGMHTVQEHMVAG